MAARAANRTRVPEPGSLRCSLITSAATRLYVPPSRWTAENLGVIDWPTAEHMPVSGAADNSNSNLRPYSEDSRMVDTLDTLRSLKVKPRRDECIRQIFRLLVPKQSLKISSSELALLYDGKPLAAVSCPIVVRALSNLRPVFAFIDKTWLSEKRYEEFGRRKQQWRSTYNTVQRMNELAFDPYYASALIAMAQDARSSTTDKEIQVYLFTPSADRKFVVQFSATIPTLYLQKFDDPYKAVVCPLVLTERALSLDRPETIIEALHEIARLYAGSPTVPVPSPKRKVMSDITNHIDISPVAGIQSRGKRRRTMKNEAIEKP